MREARADGHVVARTLRARPAGRLRDERPPLLARARVLEPLAERGRGTVPLPTAPLHEVLATTRVIFGTETIEYRLPTHTRFGAILGIKEYATPTTVGMYDALLSAPFEFVLTQSFAFLTKAAGQGLLQRQYNQMANAGDFAVSQAEELKDALDALTSNEFVMGDHHFTLQVLTGLRREWTLTCDERAALEDAQRRRGARARDARRHRSDHGARGSGARGRVLGAAAGLLFDAAAQGADHVAQLLRDDPFPQFPIWACDRQSLGRCARAADHERALALLLLAARERSARSGRRQPQGYRAHLHLRPDGLGQVGADRVSRGLALAPGRDAGDLRQGPRARDPGAGAGRHVPAAQEWRADGLQSAAAAADGRERRVPEDLAARTGARRCAAHEPRGGRSRRGLTGTLALDVPARRLSRLIEFTDATRADGIHMRLARWCESTQGDYAWVFDNPGDSLVGSLAAASSSASMSRTFSIMRSRAGRSRSISSM